MDTAANLSIAEALAQASISALAARSPALQTAALGSFKLFATVAV